MLLRLATLIAALLAVPAFAQDRPQGIAFAQAEEGTWLCRHEDPAEAIACAREQCLEQAPGSQCWPTAWCYPANWSGLMVVWLGDFHTTHPLCGAPSEASLQEALRALCTGQQDATSCDVFNVIDPLGNENAIDGLSFPGPAAPAPPVAAEAAPAAPAGEAADPAAAPSQP